ncbi:MAG: threonine synthase [Anaerolineae bacterium]|nr:threonine synthase [Anaerolineae bacterium]
MLDHVLGLKCTLCGAEYRAGEVEYVCPQHGDDGILDVVYDYDYIRRRIDPHTLTQQPMRSIWRYLPLLPVDVAIVDRLIHGTVLGSVGWTPLYAAPRLAAELGLERVWVKDDGRQPTASFKDRASAIAVVKARELGYDVVTTASTGNAAAALAGLCAAVGQKNVILVPRTAPEAKIAQLLVYGARVLLVDGTYDDAFELCLQAAPEFGWYNRNTGYNPYMSEGKKTVAYEIWEQLREWGIGRLGNWEIGKAGNPIPSPQSPSPKPQYPISVIVPVGDGCIIGGVHKGFRDLLALGWIDTMPRLIGVQAEGSSPLVDAWERGLEGWEMAPVAAHSVADSIVAGLPRDRIKALRAVRDTGGAFVRVSDAEILAAIPALARGAGVFAEPAAAAAYAGLVKAVAQGLVGPADHVVILSTGSGLKDVASARKAVGEATLVRPDLADVKRVMNQ